MEYACLFVLTVLLPPCQAVQICTHRIHQEKNLSDGHILKPKIPGIISCSTACLNRHGCVSFNINMATNQCQLNDETKCSARAQLTKDGQFAFSDISHCKIAVCLGRPSGLKNGHLETDMMEESPLGTVLPYTCDPGYMSKGELVCLNSSQWSSPTCESVSSCSMVKQIQSDTVDGEYWLRLTNFDNYTTRIYCHNMNTSTPQEFLTLPNINYGIYPKVNNDKCVKERKGLIKNCRGKGGRVWFNKIRINIRTMEVAKADNRFARLSNNGGGMFYGCAQDCYAKHPNNELGCGTKGRFDIDLRGTGWRVSDDQQWEVSGFQAMIESIHRKMNGTLINLRCGGFAGGCCPRGELHLIPFPETA